MGGDSDTVGAIVGTLVGAIHGVTPDLLKLYEVSNKWDEFGVPIRAYKLFHKHNIEG